MANASTNPFGTVLNGLLQTRFSAFAVRATLWDNRLLPGKRKTPLMGGLSFALAAMSCSFRRCSLGSNILVDLLEQLIEVDWFSGMVIHTCR